MGTYLHSLVTNLVREVFDAAVELEPSNIKEGVANDIESTAICNLVTGYEVMLDISIFILFLS